MNFFLKKFELSKDGNFEGNNILTVKKSYNEISKYVLESELSLRELRAKRPRPLRDEKILTGWNGLMIAAVARAGQVFADQAYVDAAVKASDFILKHNRQPNGELFRRWIGGEGKFQGLLDDYAFMIHGLITSIGSSAKLFGLPMNKIKRSTMSMRWITLSLKTLI